MFTNLCFFLAFLTANISDATLLMSVPKSGTHLAENLLTQLTHKKAIFLRNPNDLGAKMWQKNSFLWCHFNIACDFNRLKQGTLPSFIFINYRDPRDVCVSTVNYYSKVLDKLLGKKASFDERLTFTILFEKLDGFYGPLVHYQRAFQAEKELDVFVIKYEDLVGPQGGGDLEIQKKTIMEVAKYLNIPISEAEALHYGAAIYGHSPTFRVGQAGNWKKYFKEIHKEQFKNSKLQGVLVKLGYEKDDKW